MGISDIIEEINAEISPLFEKFTGTKVYGLAHSMIRKQGTLVEMLPALVNREGEGVYIGIDDTSPIIIYHKINSITSAVKQNGFGEKRGDNVNTYQMVIIVFLDRKKTGLLPDEFFLGIQDSFPETLNTETFKTISVRFSNVILNSAQVFLQEYQGTDFKLPAEKSLFAINYILEGSVNCLDVCKIFKN